MTGDLTIHMECLDYFSKIISLQQIERITKINCYAMPRSKNDRVPVYFLKKFNFLYSFPSTLQRQIFESHRVAFHHY